MRCLLTLLVALGIGSFAGSALADDILDIQGRTVYINGSTQIMVDDVVLPPGSPIPQKPGMRVTVIQGTAALPNLDGAGVATTVIFSYAVRGAVTSLVPLRVLGQEITVTADTGMTGVPGGNIANIALGDHLDVSGYVDTNSSLLASFIEYLPSPTPRWLLSGYVTAVNGNELTLGPQRVSLAGVAPIDCGASVVPGQFVEIRAAAVTPFTATTLLDTVTRLTCVTPVPLGTPGALGALNGIVGVILSDSSFQFGPYVVTHDATTEFRFGSADDLVEGTAIEVDGVFADNLAFTAQGVQFDAPIIRLDGPISPADVQSGPNGTVHILGNTVRRSAQLRDRDFIYANGIAQARQVELRGYSDHLGNLWATRARLRGASDPGGSRVGGTVVSVARPLLSVLGLTLDTTGATFEDPAGGMIDADTFFAGAVPGASIEQKGAWNGVDTITGGVAALIAALDPPPVESPAGIAGRTLIVGTLRSSDRVFASGFD